MPIIKTREDNEYGGVAILASKKCKMVHRKEFEVDGLEAVWAEIKLEGVQTIVGSVYINVGKIKEIDLLSKAVEKVEKELLQE